MMGSKTFFIGIMIFVALYSSLSLAIPGVPHQFFGSVTVNDAPAADGTIVSARVDNTEVASSTTVDGRYGYSPNIFYVGDPNNNRVGKTVQFFVSDVDTGQTAIFSNGAPTEINLTVTISSPTTTTSPSNGGGGGGGGSGGGTSTTTISETTTTNTSGECTESWTCTDWSVCEDNIQTRSCTDKNSCGTTDDKPFESQPCFPGEGEELVEDTEAPAQAPDITAFIIGTASNPMLVLIIIIIAVLGYLYYKEKITPPTQAPKRKR